MPNQSRFVFTEGVERVRLLRYVQTEPFMIAEIETVEDVEAEKPRPLSRRSSAM